MHDPRAGQRTKFVEPARMQGRAAIVDAPPRRQGEVDVLVEHDRIVGDHRAISALPNRLPGRRPDEVLARHAGEGLE